MAATDISTPSPECLCPTLLGTSSTTSPPRTRQRPPTCLPPCSLWARALLQLSFREPHRTGPSQLSSRGKPRTRKIYENWVLSMLQEKITSLLFFLIFYWSIVYLQWFRVTAKRFCFIIYIRVCVCVCIYIYIPFRILFHYRLIQDIEYSFPCLQTCLSVLYVIVCIC